VGAHAALIGVFIALTALSAGCLPKPYGEDDPPSEPVDSHELEAPPPGASGAGGGSGATTSGPAGGATGSSGGTSGTTAPSPAPALPPGEQMLVETFDGTPVFTAKQGTLAVVAKGVAKAGRVCADSAGIGGIEATIGPVSAGTYTIVATVQQDTSAPGKTWTVEATSWAPGPDTRKNQGDLATSLKSVTSTVQVPSGAFAATFAVRLGTTPGTCMLVDDIRVVKAPAP